MTRPLVSCIVVNWNGRHHLETCLPALDALEYPRDRRELVIVDNGSTDGSVEWLRRACPEVRILVEERNVGFAAACNRAADTAAGDLVAFINNDLRVAPTWLGRLVDALDATGAAAAGSTIVDWDGARYDFDGASMNFHGHGASRRHGRPFVAARHTASAPPEPALFACGGAMIADRSRFVAAGGFDADYFAYFEDVDLGWRLCVHGERVVHVPSALAFHRQHGSGLGDNARAALLERNALANIVKNYDERRLALVLPAALLLLEARARAAGPCRGALYRDTLVAFLDAWPALHTKRTAVQARRRRADEDVIPLFGEPLRPSFFGRAYWREQQRIVQAFGLHEVLGTGGKARMDDFIADLQGRIAELDAALVAERQARAGLDDSVRAREMELGDEVAHLRSDLAAYAGAATGTPRDRLEARAPAREPTLRRWLEGVRGRLG